MHTAALIVAAGRGTRAGGPEPKQWRRIGGKTVARWTVERFAGFAPLVLVIHPDDAGTATREMAGLPVQIVHGGADRAASVKAGLAALAEARPERVLIHDVARPCIEAGTIAAVLAALGNHPGAAPALPVTDASPTVLFDFVDQKTGQPFSAKLRLEKR